MLSMFVFPYFANGYSCNSSNPTVNARLVKVTNPHPHPHSRFILVLMTLLAYAVTKIGATLFAGVILFEAILGLSPWQSAPIIILSTAIYTALGGLLAVMLTDTVQMVIFVVGGLAGTIAAFKLSGGQSGLFQGLEDAGLSDFPHVIRPANDREFPWLGMLVGVPLNSIWYWCVD